MDRQIIEKLQDLAINFKSKYADFPYKNDIEAVFELEFKEYVLPLINNVLPFLSKRLSAHPHESIKNYLPFILAHYHHHIVAELQNHQKDDLLVYKKTSKSIETSFSNHILKYQTQPLEVRNKFIHEFVKFHLENVRAISDKSPKLALALIAKLRNPQIQSAFLKDSIIFYNLVEYTKNTLVNEDWNTWVEQYFTYPRSKDLQDYLSKWIARDKIHIKICSEFFDRVHYEQIKIWLKGKEKMAEKRAYEIKMELSNDEEIDD